MILKSPQPSVQRYELDENGAVKKPAYRGGWLQVDSGYLTWGVPVAPMKVSQTRAHLLFSKWLESMRKDVECTFGILKGRWRILKAGVLVHGTRKADMIWKTCCSLHNWLLDINGLNENWHSDWIGELGNLEYQHLPTGVQAAMTLGDDEYDTSRMGHGSDRCFAGTDKDDDDVPVWDRNIETDALGHIIVRSMKMKDFREKLVQHFDIAFKRNEGCWPRATINNIAQPDV
jgi:Plant transposon protein